MNNNSSKTHAENLSKFIDEKEKQLSLLCELLDVQNGVKRYKSEGFNKKDESIVLAYAALEECSKVLTEFLNDPDSGVNSIRKFTENAKIVVGAIADLKKKTNFFRNTILGDILKDLEKATTKFKEIAG